MFYFTLQVHLNIKSVCCLLKSYIHTEVMTVKEIGETLRFVVTTTLPQDWNIKTMCLGPCKGWVPTGKIRR